MAVNPDLTHSSLPDPIDPRLAQAASIPQGYDSSPAYTIKITEQGLQFIQEHDDHVFGNQSFQGGFTVSSEGIQIAIAVESRDGQVRVLPPGTPLTADNLIDGDRIYYPQRQQEQVHTPQMIQTLSSKTIGEMETTDKLIEAIKRSVNKVDDKFVESMQAFLTPETLAIMGGVMAVWGASHLVGIGQTVDGILLGAAIGTDIGLAASHLWNYFDHAQKAQTPEQLEQAAEYFAEFVNLVGVNTLGALVGANVGKVTDALANNLGKVAELGADAQRSVGSLLKSGGQLLDEFVPHHIDDVVTDTQRLFSQGVNDIQQFAKRLGITPPEPELAGIGRLDDITPPKPKPMRMQGGTSSGSAAQQPVVQQAVDELRKVHGPAQAKIAQESLELLTGSSALGPQGAALAGKRLQSLSTQQLPRLQESLETLQSLLGKATDTQKKNPAYVQLANKLDNTLNKVKDLKPQDLVGALRDEVNLPIKKPWQPRQGVQTYNHQNEVNEAINSLSYVDEVTGEGKGLNELINKFRGNKVYKGNEEQGISGLKNNIPRRFLNNLQKELDSTIDKIDAFRNPATYQRQSNLEPQQVSIAQANTKQEPQREQQVYTSPEQINPTLPVSAWDKVATAEGSISDPSPSSAPQQSSSYGQLLAVQQFVEQHLKTKPQLPSNQEVDNLLAKLSPLRAGLKQRQQVQHMATIELEQLEQRGERSILNPLGYSDHQHDQVFYVWQRASDAVRGQERENDHPENRVTEYAQIIRSYQQWEQQPETNQMKQIQQVLAQPEMQSQLAFAQRNDALFRQSMEAAAAFDQPPFTPDTVRAMHSAFLTEGSLPSEEQMATLAAMTNQHQTLLAQQEAATPDLAVLGA